MYRIVLKVVEMERNKIARQWVEAWRVQGLKNLGEVGSPKNMARTRQRGRTILSRD